MPLTPEDVSNKRFTPVRLREGYDMGEVDQFLDEVEAELARLTKENDDLRSKLSAAQTGGGSGFQDTSSTAQTPAVQEREPEPPPAPEPTPVPVPVAEPVAAAAGPETIRVETVPQASNAAARLLEIATRNADELVESGQERGRQDHRRGPHQVRAARVRVQGQGRPRRVRRPHPRPDARLRDRRAPPADVR